ncbi:hypothetical protein K458DRAFT_424526 [Lentithecium fluviatile CBS 122367]|uniref:Uncharacterized protein n=1 Tax=Lentithecium fluviatile CBS 122367 TaxID=1168545 RepID=A0A6G1IEY4_9PLEO|nr:hypothetical protein K458DRAFT_424526 [Lentithecium fluviatile CBS 122367]
MGGFEQANVPEGVETPPKAGKLHRRLKLEFVPTSDLAEHLVYNPKTKSLAVFHQVEWLKAQIRYTKDRKLDEAVEVSLAAGTLPPQLLDETLYTIYVILFPIGINKKSLRFAKRLVRAERPFDRNLLAYDGPVHKLPANFKCVYWSRRLKALQALVEVRPPKNKIVSWFERHTSERNALTVAIIGLFLSALFGFLGLLVGILQVVVSIQAWKYPVQGSSG